MASNLTPVMCELDVFSIIKTTTHWCWQECASQVGLSRSFSSSFWHSLWRCWSISIGPSILRASFGDWQHMSIGFIDGLNLSGELVRLAASGLSQPRGWVITSARCPVSIFVIQGNIPAVFGLRKDNLQALRSFVQMSWEFENHILDFLHAAFTRILGACWC